MKRKSPERRRIPWSAIAIIVALIGNIGTVIRFWVEVEHRFTSLEKDVEYIKAAVMK